MLKFYYQNSIMNIRLLFEKCYWALLKRIHIEKQKTYEDWLAKGYLNTPEVSFIIQSHNKSMGVIHIVKRLRSYPNAEIIVIDDGSELHHTKNLTNFLCGGNEFLIRANDLYENVMYDKAIRFANGFYIVLLQDDDNICGMEWLREGLAYFRKYPDMVILGGLEGLEFWIDEVNKYGALKKIPCMNKFQFVHTVNRSPMLLNKSLYTQYLKHFEFSFAPFQCDDSELCLRAWLSGLKVGWYDTSTEFKSLMAGGMRIWNNELISVQGERNSRKLYEMYKTHSSKITRRVEEANKTLL